MLEVPERPAPPRGLADRFREWVEWIGVARVLASALAFLTVLGFGYWLLKPPAATTESKLPYAGSASTSTTTTASPVASESTTAEVATTVVVHVAGAVQMPGVYQLSAGSRVVDAIAAAGGLASDANSDVVNLASLLVDGERVYVPTVGEALPPIVAGAGGGSAGTPVESGPININTAGIERLQDLPGVGPATAAAIVAHRDQYGPFISVEALADVRGIGPAKLEAIRGLAVV